MAKSKKRNRKSKRKQTSSSQSHLKMLPLDTVMVMPYIASLTPYNKGKISPSLVLNGMEDRKYMSPDDIDKIEDAFYEGLYPLLTSAMSSPYLDQSMNVYIDNTDSPNRSYNMDAINKRREFKDKCDMLDFTEYKPCRENSDIFFDAFNRVIESDDPSILWSTRETLNIKINDTTEYLVKRGAYDKENRTIQYEIRAYESVYLVRRRLVKVPSLIVKGNICLLPIAAIEKTMALLQSMYLIKNPTHEPSAAIDMRYTMSNINSVIIKNVKDAISKQYPEIEWDWDKMYLPVFEITEALYTAHIAAHCRKRINAQTIPASFSGMGTDLAEKTLSTAISNLLLGLFRDDENRTMITDKNDNLRPGSAESAYNIMGHMIQKTMLPFACIAVTNGLIADKKMSRPATRTKRSSVTHEIVQTDAVPTERKTRILSDSIKISSVEKPEAPTLEKIIRYSMSEWERAGHFRHYKSGKVVQIKPSVVHRRCVDISKQNTDPSLGTNYIVKNKVD